MGATKWTTEQQKAIDLRNRDILVSAAAGSGKTAVLVERIIKRITTDQPPTDIDRLLVVTFTKAAASEMSQRIGTAIARGLEENPENQHLQNQLVLLSKADIKTIHSFCLQVIKEYYHVLEIDPAIRTADLSEIKLLQRDVLEEYFEDLYADENNQTFFNILETFAEETKDNRLKEVVLQLYSFAQGFPYPEEALLEMAESFNLKENETINDCPWLSLIKDSIRYEAELAQYFLTNGIAIAEEHHDEDLYVSTLEKDLIGVRNLLDSLSGTYRDWHLAYVSINFARLTSYKGENKEVAAVIKGLRDEAKGAIKKIGETFFCYGAELQDGLIRNSYPIAKGLAELTIGFMQAFAKAKLEKLIIDFNDYEHFCLKILVEHGSTLHNLMPTSAAQEIQKRYDEIIIDEYQDSNLVQELILASVSGESQGKNNRFMVGDVKQSIYRFRLAMPEIFNEKYQLYPLEDNHIQQKVILSKNFRSRKSVLDGINFLFFQLMQAGIGDVEYNEETALYAGATFPETDKNHAGANEVLLVQTSESEDTTADSLPEEFAELDRRRLEALAISEKIHALMAEDYHVVDKKTGEYRPLQYKDIAILMRSMKNWGTVLDEIFGNKGIPYYAETAEGYYDVPEIETALNLLRLLDNPRQDIPLLGVLHSPLYALSADELVILRKSEPQGLFFDCVLTYADSGEDLELQEKLNRFLSDLNRWREKKKELSLYELLYLVYQESGYFDYVGMTAGGNLRQANLRLLLEKAEQFEKQSSQKGLFYFIRYVEDLKTAEADTSSAKLQSEADDLVRVMTIHKSKGLEFPVVFVSDMGKQFNEMDLRNAVITHQTWGLGIDYMDLEKRATYRTLSKTALTEIIRHENLSEEMRVLYVALTRAKEKLILTGTVKNFAKSKLKWERNALALGQTRLPVYRLRKAKSYLDWAMPSLVAHPDGTSLRSEEAIFGKKAILNDCSKWNITLLEKEDILSEIIQEKEVATLQQGIFSEWDNETDYSGQREEIFRLLSWEYPYMQAVGLGTKISISELKRKFSEEPQSSPDLAPLELALPKQMELQTKLTSAQIGTAMHTVMQFIDFSLDYTENLLAQQIATLVSENILSPLEAKELRRNELLQFLQSPLAKRMKHAEYMQKEKNFAMLVPLKELFPEEAYQNLEEDVLINGIIDSYFVENGKIVLVDYKSDRLFQASEYKKRYEIQLSLYKKALEQALEQKVSEVCVYAFAINETILF